MFQLKSSAVIIHIAGWLIFLSLPMLFLFNRPDNVNIFSVSLLPYYLLFCCTYIFLFYFNTTFLIPQLYFQRKFFLYWLVMVLMLVIIFFLKPFDQLMAHAGSFAFGRGDGPRVFVIHSEFGRDIRAGELAPPAPRPWGSSFGRIDAVSIFLFVMILALSMAVRISQQLRAAEQRVTRAEADKANAELSFLKAQINPHFLFNTLNNIYTLAVTKNEHTANSIMKLSNIMRYVTDDIGEDFVSLQSEVDCLSDYIDLQRMRLGKNTQVDFTVSGHLENRTIAPLIFMTFVENVFKYGASNHEPALIIIKLFSEKQTISFFCQNNIFPVKQDQNNGRAGIGIANTRQRLEYLYPDKHFLNIITANGLYTVQLTVQV